MNKNNIQVFGQDWFKYHQNKLLQLANNPIGRYILRIHGNRSSVGKNKITKIMPNGIFWEEDGKQAFEVRTHDKFAKRLYYSGYHLWAAMHQLDDWFLDTVAQGRYSFGFDSFGPLYPAATEASPINGKLTRINVDQTWADFRAATGTHVVYTDGQQLCGLAGSTTNDQWKNGMKGIFMFDSSGIGAGATIDTATFSLCGFTGFSKQTALGKIEGVVVSASPAADDTLEVADYDIGVYGATEFGTRWDSDTWPDGSYDDMTMNASGKAHVDPAGLTRFGTMDGWHFDDSPPTWGSGQQSALYCHLAASAGTAKDPKLAGTYTAVSTFTPKTIMII